MNKLDLDTDEKRRSYDAIAKQFLSYKEALAVADIDRETYEKNKDM